jgi:hypothetical protein
VLPPVAFFSKGHWPAKDHYEICDEVLSAIVNSFEQWRPECEVSAHPIKILMDHNNLEYFMISKLLNWRQTRWSEFLLCFTFKMIYCPGKQYEQPVALTWMPGAIPPMWVGQKTSSKLC